MMSDVCKHCVNAPCLEVCPTGSIVRTEFDTVYIQEPVCNGCRDCITACPFGVIHVSAEKHIAQKCTFCYDRLQNGLVPACAQACPTRSIQFGPIAELKQRAEQRVKQFHGPGAERGLSLWGRHEDPGRPERVLFADGPARDLRAAFRGASAGSQPVGLAGVAQGDRGVTDIALGAFVSFGRSEERSPPRRGRGGLAMNREINTCVADPGWHGLIIWYFFLGGIAAGAYVMAALADLFGDADDRPGVRVAYYLAFPLVCVCGLLLIVDLGRPERFWHMMIQSNTGWPMFKWWSPMSAGSWALSAFGMFSFASFVGVLAEDGWLGLRRFSPLASRLRTGWTGRLFAPGRLAFGFLPGIVHRSLAAGKQPADLVQHHLDGSTLSGLLGIDGHRHDGLARSLASARCAGDRDRQPRAA